MRENWESAGRSNRAVGGKRGRFDAGRIYLLILREGVRLFSHLKIRAVRVVEPYGLPTLS